VAIWCVAFMGVLMAPALSRGGLIGDLVQFQARSPSPLLIPFGPETATIVKGEAQFFWFPLPFQPGQPDVSIVVVFGRNDLTLGFADLDIFPGNVSLPGATLSFVDLNPKRFIDDVAVTHPFTQGNYANNEFQTDLTDPHSFDLTFTSLEFGPGPSSDAVTLSI